MNKNTGVLFVLLVVTSAVWSAAQPQFAVKQSQKDSNGVTLRTATGMMRVELCGDRVVHVVATPEAQIPTPKVPIVTGPCKADNVHINIAKQEARLSTPALAVAIDTTTGAIKFLSPDGNIVLAEPKPGGKSFDVPSVFEAKTWQVQQSFLSPSDEALYGLGQHQEGIFNVRGVPIRLHQANTNISIPMLLSSRGYGLLWNNPSLTDFNPADQVVSVDPKSGRGKFTTAAKVTYGFRLASDNRDQLIVRVDDNSAIDITNMWTQSVASGVLELEAGKEYEVSAKGGPAGVQLAVRQPADTTTFRSELGDAIDYYFFYGPELNTVISEYRHITGDAPLFPKW